MVDDDGNMVLTRDELEEQMVSGTMDAYLQATELSPKDARDLFTILDEDESGYVSIEEFVRGSLRLKGTARAADMSNVAVDVKALRQSDLQNKEDLCIVHDLMRQVQRDLKQCVKEVV